MLIEFHDIIFSLLHTLSFQKIIHLIQTFYNCDLELLKGTEDMQFEL